MSKVVAAPSPSTLTSVHSDLQSELCQSQRDIPAFIPEVVMRAIYPVLSGTAAPCLPTAHRSALKPKVYMVKAWVRGCQDARKPSRVTWPRQVRRHER